MYYKLLFLLIIVSIVIVSCESPTKTKTIEPVTFSLLDGEYDTPQTVTLQCATADVTIRYTTDGAEPTEASSIYVDPILIETSTVLKGKAYKSNWKPSVTTTATYTILPRVATPVFFPGGETYNQAVYVNITCSTPDAEIRYTMDGSQPDTTSTVYVDSTSIYITSSCALKARAYKTGLNPSEVAAAVYTITGTVAQPVFNPGGAWFYSNNIPAITITCSTPGATIRYTTDQSSPSETSPEYVAPIQITVSMTIKARAFKDGFEPSKEAFAKYTIIDVAIQMRGLYSLSNNFSYDVQAGGSNYAYGAFGTAGVRSINFSNLSNPTLEDSYDTSSDDSKRLYKSGNYLYVANTGLWGGMLCLNVSDPTSMSMKFNWVAIQGLHGFNADVRDVYVLGSYVFIANGTEGITIFNIGSVSNPTLPQSTYWYSNHSYEAHCIFAKQIGSTYYVYIASGNNGFKILSFNGSSNPVYLGSVATSDYTEDIFIKDSYAYVANGASGLKIYNISNPGQPSYVTRYSVTGGAAKAVQIQGSFAYVAFGAKGIHVLSITNPTFGQLVVKNESFGGDSKGIYIDGDKGFIANNIGLKAFTTIGLYP